MIAKSAPPDSDLEIAINHAAQVAQDAAGYTWSAVREWSQSCMSHISEDKDGWRVSPDLLARERTRISWLKGKPPQEVKVPCHDHNTGKCNERATHHSEGRTWVHGCAVCIYGGNDDSVSQSASTHVVRTCRRKGSLKYQQDDSRGDFRRKTNYQYQKKDSRPDQNKSKN